MAYVLLAIVLMVQFSGVCGTALSIGDWQPAVSESGQAATLNTHNGPYDLERVNTCFHDKYSDIVARDAENWVSIEEWKEFGLGLSKVPNIPVDMNNADIKRWESPVADLTINEGGVEKRITATIGFGHGVASLKCGDCFLLETSGTNIPADSWIHNNAAYTDLLAHDKQTRYAVIRTVDIATWSLEISDPSLYYLLPLDGRIDHSTQPKYQPVDCKVVMSAAVTDTPTATTSTTTTMEHTATTTVETATTTTTSSSVAISTTSLATTTASTTNGGGSCTGQPCDSAWHTSSHCRSKWGHCGTTAGHCNAESLWCGSDAAGCSCGGKSGRRLRGAEARSEP
jgi:hypothetical protein